MSGSHTSPMPSVSRIYLVWICCSRTVVSTICYTIAICVRVTYITYAISHPNLLGLDLLQQDSCQHCYLHHHHLCQDHMHRLCITISICLVLICCSRTVVSTVIYTITICVRITCIAYASAIIISLGLDLLHQDNCQHLLVTPSPSVSGSHTSPIPSPSKSAWSGFAAEDSCPHRHLHHHYLCLDHMHRLCITIIIA